MLDTGRVLTNDGSSVPLNSEISRMEGDALQRLIRRYRPMVTLEVGLAYGVSALFICEALAEVHGEKHIVIDPYQFGVQSIEFVAGASHTNRVGFDGLGLLNLERAGYRKFVEFYNEPSHRALPSLEASDRTIDFALIDGWHTFDYAMIDFFYIDRMLKVGGVIVLDDALYPAVRKLARYIVTHRCYRTVMDEPIPSLNLKRRVFNGVTSALRIPATRRITKHMIRPDVLELDLSLGLPPENFIAFQKTAMDVLGDGSAGSRRWDQHHDF